jgi:hypothetical protein
MQNAIEPVVGQWYRLPDADKGQVFQVIEVDEDEDAVEVQYFDGNIEELPHDAWQAQGFENCAAPEDWTGPYGVVVRDDLGYSDTGPSSAESLEAVDGSQNNAGGIQDEVGGDEAV